MNQLGNQMDFPHVLCQGMYKTKPSYMANKKSFHCIHSDVSKK